MSRFHNKRRCLFLTFTVFLVTIFSMKTTILKFTMELPYTPMLITYENNAVNFPNDKTSNLVDDPHHTTKLSHIPIHATAEENKPWDFNQAMQDQREDVQSKIIKFEGDKHRSEVVSDDNYTTESLRSVFRVDEDKNKTVNINDEDERTKVVGQSELADDDGWHIINDEKKLRTEIDNIHKLNYKVIDGDTCTQTVPDCVIVGVGKCGTRELIDFMSIHPNIISRKGHYQIPSVLFSESSESNIKDKMPCKYRDQISVLKADAFLTQKSKPSALFRINPNMKIIAILREPVSRLISHLSFRPSRNSGKRVLSETETLNNWFEQNVNKLGFMHNTKVQMSKYDKGLERYLNIFKRENILVIESNEFKADPTSVIRRVEDFLGIKKFVSNEHFALNPRNKFYCIRMAREVSKSMVCYESNRGRNKTIIADKHMKALRTYFRPHNENLFRLIGKRYDW